jgi:hypothetical protein
MPSVVKEPRMNQLDSRAVSMSLEAYAADLLAESTFFSGLAAGEVHPAHVRDVFGQYYLWRNRFHRWFGLCVAKSDPYDEARGVPRVLGELLTCLRHEIKGDHHRLAWSFLAALGIDDPSRIKALPVTDSYAESFLCCYAPGDRSGDEALAALAGRGLVGPGCDQIIASALPRYYGVTSGLEFFGQQDDVEAKHFRAMWRALVRGRKADTGRLIEAARLEIWEHITFWDDVYYTLLGAENELAS